MTVDCVLHQRPMLSLLLCVSARTLGSRLSFGGSDLVPGDGDAGRCAPRLSTVGLAAWMLSSVRTRVMRLPVLAGALPST
eukprot:15010955-Alexandrium_andersonii.AAC.1